MSNLVPFKSKPFLEFMNSLIMVEELAGRLGDNIYKYAYPDGKIVYVKYAQGSTSNTLFMEFERLSWLNENQFVVKTPSVEYFEQEIDEAVLVLSNVEGDAAYKINEDRGIEESITLVAHTLKLIHSIDTYKATNFRSYTQSILNEYAEYIQKDQMETEDFIEDNDNKTPTEVLNYLQNNKHLLSEDVFVHGDYCLPNVIIDAQKNCGVIDWANAGVCDKYIDFSAIEGSIKRNFGEEYIDLFYESYGIDKKNLDVDKLKYCNLIDKFSKYVR